MQYQRLVNGSFHDKDYNKRPTICVKKIRSRSRSHGKRLVDVKRTKIDIPEEPEVGEIYRGQISSIRTFGCFVQIFGIRKKVEGLVHISQLKKERVVSAGDVVKRGQKVFVKVLSRVGERTSLSMRDVDQTSGEDLNPHDTNIYRKADADGKNDSAVRNPDRPNHSALQQLGIIGVGGNDSSNAQDVGPTRKKRLTSPERWELQQMRAANCIQIT
uniref:S1 motif domain-containing protein n=1 Tax=Romanomermis culicivorax TaxID=13658 RepID=A0A915JHK7_ROMCU